MNALTKDFTDAVEKQFESLNKDVQDALREAKTAQGIIGDLEQKMASARHRGSGAPETAGQTVAQSEQVDMLCKTIGSTPARARIEVKEITSATGSAGALDAGSRDPNVNNFARRVPRIRDLLTTVNTNSGTVEYVDQVTAVNGAAPQVEGQLKAESDYDWELRNLVIRTIAHWTKASVQILADAPQLQSLIDGELRFGLAIAEDLQLLNGDGTGANLTGLVPNATDYSAEFTVAGETMIDKIGMGMLQVSLQNYVPNGIAVRPSDWMRMRLLKDADGKYLLGDPQSNPAPLLFGLPVVPTTAMAADKFMVADFARAATLYDRQLPTVEISTEDGDNFRRNMVTIRAEERVGLAIKNPLATSYGDFGNLA